MKKKIEKLAKKVNDGYRKGEISDEQGQKMSDKLGDMIAKTDQILLNIRNRKKKKK